MAPCARPARDGTRRTMTSEPVATSGDATQGRVRATSLPAGSLPSPTTGRPGSSQPLRFVAGHPRVASGCRGDRQWTGKAPTAAVIPTTAPGRGTTATVLFDSPKPAVDSFIAPKEHGDTERCATWTNSQDGDPQDPDSSRAGILVTWRSEAACLGEEPELFFPIGTAHPALVQIEVAKAVCRHCDVVDTCLSWAMESRQDTGVWGGLSEDERRALRRRTARAHRAG